MTEYQMGTTIILQAEYFDTNDEPLDADAAPTVEVWNSRNQKVQTGLTSTKISAGKYQYRYRTAGLKKGTYFHVWTALFNSDPDVKSGSFSLLELVT
jgi:hypothetical protein